MDTPETTGALSLRAWAAHAQPEDRQPAAHHLLLLDRLEALAHHRMDRLIVLMPPGSAKSTYASVLFPAWFLAGNPGAAVIAASHTSDLASHFGRQVRNIVSEHTEPLGIRLATDSRSANRFGTNIGSQYFATGINGPVTGRRADLVIIDDPIKSHVEADAAAAREHLWRWYQTELLTRLRKGGRIVLVMTRWHQDDLAGRLLATDASWHILRLPALAEANDPMLRMPGAPLWPDWQDELALGRIRASVGSRVWQSLYQQAPVSDAGSMFHLPSITILDASPVAQRAVRAWDIAASEATDGRDPDWTAGVKLIDTGGGRYVVSDVVRFRAGPHAVAEAIAATAQQDGHGVPIGLPQDPGSAGKLQLAWLQQRLSGFRVVSGPETGSKVLRATPVAARIEAGGLAVVRAGFTDAFLAELRDFPHGRKDDQVDALSRAHAMLAVQFTPARRRHLSMMAR